MIWCDKVAYSFHRFWIFLMYIVFFPVNQHYSDMGREVNELDWSLEIEGPAKYPGFRLNPDLRCQLTKVSESVFIIKTYVCVCFEIFCSPVCS